MAHSTLLDISPCAMFLLVGALMTFLAGLRIYSILPAQYGRCKRTQKKSDTYSVAVFLGSGSLCNFFHCSNSNVHIGGHTTEAMTLISALDSKRYNRRTYLVSEGDNLSVQKAIDFETKLGSSSHNVCPLLQPDYGFSTVC